jgi:dTDP-4-amino-4,6-dideoxygalactose transaminase
MKKFLKVEDLSLFGAAPAFETPLHVGKPNMGNRQALTQRMNDILDAGWLTNYGPVVKQFESAVAEETGAKHCVAMCNGTIALEIAIRALELKGEVIVPSFTFIATAHALQWQEITPVFADIDPSTHTLDPHSVETMITPRTTGIIGVHLWGRPCKTEELQSIANRYSLSLFFDASHAFTCTHHGKKIGNFGRCEVFSFHATKFFNCFEGGAVVTNDSKLAAKMRLMKNFGFAGYDNVIYPGTNGKMTEICAAMGLTNLESIDEFRNANKKNYEAYRKGLNGIPGLRLISYNEHETCNYQYIVVEVANDFPLTRDAIIAVFHMENILARKYFWPGCHRMLPYRAYYPHAGLLLPNTTEVAERIIVLPTGVYVDESKIGIIIDILNLIKRNPEAVRRQLALKTPIE